MDLQLQEEIAYRSSFGVGGHFWARCQVGPDRDQILQAKALAARCGVPIVILGGGTNILIADEGLDSMVLQIVMPENETIAFNRDYQTDDTINVRVYASASWDNLVACCVAQNLQGLEHMSGIPGTVGGAIAGSIGAYGQKVSDTIIGIETVDLKTGSVQHFAPEECEFGYRTSIFNRPEHLDRYLITQAIFRLRKADSSDDLVAARDRTLCIRQAKGMLAGQHHSAGSFFKNPTLPDGTRTPAATLIEQAGFWRGYSRNGRAGISLDHALALVNLGIATAADIIALAREIQEKVVQTSGIVLEPEVRLIGFPEYPLLRQ